jgi:RHS repeat-associated protein
VVLRETQVYTGTDYVRVDWEVIRYNLLHNPLETIRGNGSRESATWSHCCGKQTERQADSTEWFYDYDGLKRVLSKTKLSIDGSIGFTERYTYDGNGNRLSETHSGGDLSLTTRYVYDALGRKVEQTDPAGLLSRWEYSADGLTETEYLPSGGTRITQRYLDGRLKAIRGSAVIAEFYDYGVDADGSNWTKHFIGSYDASSPRWRMTKHDVLGRLIEEAEPAYDGSVQLVQYSYNDHGLLERRTEPGSAASLYVYNALGELVRSGLDVDGDGQLTLASNDRIQDDEHGYVVEGGDWYQVRTDTVYPRTGSGDGRVVSQQKERLTGWSGNVRAETIHLDIHGNATIRTTEMDPASKTVLTRVDLPNSEQDSLTRYVNGLLVEQGMQHAPSVYTYDALQRVSTVKQAHHSQAATTQYHPDTGQLILQTDAAGHATAFTYVSPGEAGAGQIAVVTDALGQKSYRSYDLLGRQIRIWGETDYPQAYSYNTLGELQTLITWRDSAGGIDFSTSTWPNPAGGDVTTWSYQPATGLLTRKEYADGNGTDYRYDAAKRLAVRTWARNGGLDTTYRYDPATGELLNVNYAATDTADIGYTYDRLGRQTTVADATGTRSFDYDNDTLQLAAETLDSTFYQGHVLQRTYENGSEMNGLPGRASGYSLKDSGGTTSVSSATYRYDAANRLATITDGSDTFTYGYESDSNLLARLTGPQHTVAYTYESDRNVIKMIDNKTLGETASVSSYSYTYDALGRRMTREQSGSAFAHTSTDTFTYNTRSEVTASTNDVQLAAEYTPSYSYDQIGNRKTSTGIESVTYSANALNQYADIQVSSLSSQPFYDLDGNLTGDGGNWTYNWNNENRLTSATDGSRTIHFTYDYQGRLVKKDDGRTIEVYVYDGWNRIATFDSQVSTLSLQVSYLWGLDLSGSLQGTGGISGLLKAGSLYPTYDANGNIMQKLDGNGATVMNVAYDPFGNTISGTLVGEFGFSTKPFVEGPDWYYYGFRYYDPVTGRWPSRDPWGENWSSKEFNVYAFITNDAANYADYLGLAKGKRGRRPNKPKGGVTAPPRPEGHGGFHHYGNWGGPGWANGEWRSETDPLPDPDNPDPDDPYNPPVDDRDACYEGHDRCINGCPDQECYPDEHSDCVEGCDEELAQCLRDTGNRGLESWAFDTVIPWLVH